MKEVLHEYEPTTQIFKVNADSLIELNGEKGTFLHIDPSVLQRQNGSVVQGEMEVHLLELNKKRYFRLGTLQFDFRNQTRVDKYPQILP